MRSYIEKACEEIDAAMFTGDAFIDGQHRKELTEYMVRWQKALKAWEKTEVQYKKELDLEEKGL